MILTQEQISEIRNFISKKGIKYLDVQMEIIDHTASMVEERMTADPNLTFEQALKETHASFGIFGFGGMEDAMINGMSKKYRRLFWKHFFSFFGVKYILLILLGAFLVYKIQVVYSAYFQWITFSLLAVATVMAILFVTIGRQKGFKNLLVYRMSIAYLMSIGAFLQIFNLLINEIPDVEIFGINRNFVMISGLVVIFMLYALSAIRIAKIGIGESKSLLNKYKLLRIS